MRKIALIFLIIGFVAAHANEQHLPWSKERQDWLVDQAQVFQAEQRSKFPRIRYPASKDQLRSISLLFKPESVKLVGYGSLLNKISAAKTLSPYVLDSFQPVVVFGGKRTFDRNITNPSKWGEKVRENDTGMLNVVPTKNLSQMFNGVVMEVDLAELERLVEREVGYDLIPVVAMNWNEALKEDLHFPHFFIAYTFSASSSSREGKIYISPCVNPVPGYSYASMAGAAEYGEAFHQFWIDTTYLADRKTPFILWLKDPRIDCDCERGCRLPHKKKFN